MLRGAALAEDEQLEGRCTMLSPWKEPPHDSAWMRGAIYSILETL